MGYRILLLAVALVGCNLAGNKCKSYGTTGGGGTLSTFGASDCDDGAKYEVSCKRPDTTSGFDCSCIKNGTVGKTFKRTEELPMVSPKAKPAIDMANEACGWKLKR